MDEELIKAFLNTNWNCLNRKDIIERLQKNTYDIIVIGGGITGAGVAREAALRGLKIALIEMQDFAAGTSSRSSKLAHGGIRYLASAEMELVKEATTERNWLRAHLPHLTRPIPFLFANWEGGKDKKRSIKAAVKLYDFLSDNDQEFKNYKQHSWLEPEEIANVEPEMKKDGNLGGAIYYDNNIDDARLTIETIKEAIIRGSDALNYCKVIDYIKVDGTIVGVKCEDLEDKITFSINARQVVNATGIWTDQLLEIYPDDVPKPLIRPTKGVHLVYKKEHVKNRMATIIRSINDGRAFFILPRGDFTLIGTTDTDYNDDLANPYCAKEDADYLIASVQYYFPKAELEYKNIVSAYAGIRPLVMQKGKSESEISRKHLIFFSEDGLLSITGGKLTTFRKMAEDLFLELEKKNIFKEISRNEGFSKQLYVSSFEREIFDEKVKKIDLILDQKIIDLLYQQYGRGALEILEIASENPSYIEPLEKNSQFIPAEIIYILRNEFAPHLIDVLCRRTEISILIRHDKQKGIANKVARLMASEYLWDENKTQNEISIYLEHIKKSVEFV
ncbi:MAG: glycerol-3-phosphate dehydrogenase/oxidase [Candidatus Lokiarchaeota archaeon]|nr:glycerol-3-phosphate dehydrogenase/oxidase [Candidatus Lokiarchaeota archaeon]